MQPLLRRVLERIGRLIVPHPVATVVGKPPLEDKYMGWATGKIFEPMALVVGSMICIAAANAGATSQDLKTGFLVGATPRYQQIALFIGAIVSSLVIGWTIPVILSVFTCTALMSSAYSFIAIHRGNPGPL